MKTNVLITRTMSVLVMLLALPTSGQAKLNVVATTADLGAIAREIGGDLVQVTILARPTEDVHFVDPKPSYVVKLSRADVLIEGGAELESGWLPPLLDGARNPKLAAGQAGRVACAEGLALLEVPTTLDRSKGDLHAMGNPHFMTDPMNAQHAAQRICEAFSTVDQEHSVKYLERLNTFTKRLDDRMVAWQKQLEPFHGKSVVAFHNSWPYFARRFGIKIDLFLEPKPGIPPSPAHLAEVIARMKSERIGVILVEPYQNRKTAETVSAKTGAVVVEFTQYPGGVRGTEGGYVELIDYLVNTLSAALSRGSD
jgi:zinc/manganese transport system substrate-binding protein